MTLRHLIAFFQVVPALVLIAFSEHSAWGDLSVQDLMERDRAYLEHVKKKKEYQKQVQQGIRDLKKKRAWYEWRKEVARLRYIQRRDSKSRMPASVHQDYQERLETYRKNWMAKEKARREYVELQRRRQAVREAVERKPLSVEIRRRNEEPWNE